MQKYIDALRAYISKDCREMYREDGGTLPYCFLTPGSATYKDVLEHGVMHEYYSPDEGKPVINPGFQNWNMLVLNMIDWYEKKSFVEEF